MPLEFFKNLFNKEKLEYLNGYIILGLILTPILLASYLFVLFKLLPNHPQYSSITNVFSVLIGSSLTGSISLAIYEKNLKNERSKLISSIRSINAHNSAVSKLLIIALEEEIKSIDINSNYTTFKLPLPCLLRITDIMIQDIVLVLEKESKKILKIATLTDYLIRCLEYREKIILNNKPKTSKIKEEDQHLVNELKSLQKSIKDYEEEIFGDKNSINVDLSKYKKRTQNQI